jgi:hypothetical protein
MDEVETRTSKCEKKSKSLHSNVYYNPSTGRRNSSREGIDSVKGVGQ